METVMKITEMLSRCRATEGTLAWSDAELEGPNYFARGPKNSRVGSALLRPRTKGTPPISGP